MAFYPTSGLKQYICKKDNRLINVSLINGEPLDEEKTYIVASPDFLIHGGDDFAEVLKFYQPRNEKSITKIRDFVAEYAKQNKVLNPKSKPIVNPKEPAIILVEDCDSGEKFEEKKTGVFSFNIFRKKN